MSMESAWMIILIGAIKAYLYNASSDNCSTTAEHAAQDCSSGSVEHLELTIAGL